MVIGVISPKLQLVFAATLPISLGLPSSEWEGINQNPKLTWNLKDVDLGKRVQSSSKSFIFGFNILFGCGSCRSVRSKLITFDGNPEIFS